MDLAPSTCSTSFQDHARRTPEEWRDIYGIPSTRRSSNERSGSGPGDGQTHQSVKVGLYFFDIAYVTPHHLPFRDIEDDMASIACPFMLQYGQLPLFIAKLLSYVAALHYR